MWKKALWVYLGLYVLGVLYIIISYAVTGIQKGEFDLVGTILSTAFFLPALLVALALRGKKVSVLLMVLSLLLLAVPVAGILKFNNLDLLTIGKALVFVPMIVALCYFGIKRITAKKK